VKKPAAAPGSRRRTWPRRAGSAVAAAGSRGSADVADEAHVEHPVGLVEDEDLDVERSMVPWPTWSSRRPGVATTISGRAQRPDLRVEADAAVDGVAPDGPRAP
jgi:hypothetical protein